MAHPAIAFRLESEDRTLFDLPAASASLIEGSDAARLERLAAIMGRDFADNSVAIDANREGFRLTGFAGLPTLNRPTSQHQYLFVNGRPVRDKLLNGAVRGAYQDFLARDRNPMVALFLDAPTELVDVNVHPAKTEVRFRDAGIVRGLIVGALRTALSAAGHRASTTVSDAALGAFRPHTGYANPLPLGRGTGTFGALPRGLAEAATEFFSPFAEPSARMEMPLAGSGQRQRPGLSAGRGARATARDLHRGADQRRRGDRRPARRARAPAAREAQEPARGRGCEAPGLLLPEVVEIGEDGARRLTQRAAELAEMGLVLEPFGLGRRGRARDPRVAG